MTAKSVDSERGAVCNSIFKSWVAGTEFGRGRGDPRRYYALNRRYYLAWRDGVMVVYTTPWREIARRFSRRQAPRNVAATAADVPPHGGINSSRQRASAGTDGRKPYTSRQVNLLASWIPVEILFHRETVQRFAIGCGVRERLETGKPVLDRTGSAQSRSSIRPAVRNGCLTTRPHRACRPYREGHHERHPKWCGQKKGTSAGHGEKDRGRRERRYTR